MEVDKGKLMQAVTQEKLLEYQRIRYDKLRGSGAERLTLDLMVLESAGGACPHCKREWKKVEVVNAYADFTYFVPDCRCYETCAKCGMSLYGVTFPNREVKEYKCPRCGHREPERWRLTCVVCGTNGTNHTGKPYRYVCGSCKATSKRGKKDALRVEE